MAEYKPVVTRRMLYLAARLLDMQYRPAELAQAMGVGVGVVYKSWVPKGCPHERVAGQIWISGSDFLGWLQSDGVQRK